MNKSTYYDFFTNKRNIEIQGGGETSEILSKFSIGDYDLYNIALIDLDSHYVSYLDGTPVPIGLRSDYISNGRFSNANYDLEKLVEVLSKRDDIAFIIETGFRSTEKIRDISNMNIHDIISDIPYYNAESHKNKTVTFEWCPSKNDIDQVFTNLNERNPKYKTSEEIWRSIFETDILKLRKYGVAKYSSYYQDDSNSNCDNFTF